MAAAAANFLIKKGKRQTAAYIQGVCLLHGNSDIANEVFETILNPAISIDDWATIDWCRWLLAGGKTPEEYTQTVRNYDTATACGLVWTANFVAYRCRTCGISPCMSLCSDCFQRGNHEGHDFNMFRSQAGGACDCGDKSVMRETGFCERHGPQNQINKPQAPPDLLCVADALMPRLFLRLIQHLRDNSERAIHDGSHSVILSADGFLTLLHNHCEMGAAMRSVMAQALINPEVYNQLALNTENADGSVSTYKVESLTKYLEARNSFEFSSEDMNYDSGTFSSSYTYSVDSLKNSSFLDELMFWTTKFEFPQRLVCLLLNMMPDLNYKAAFTKIFVRHYDRISKMLAKSFDSDALSNRVVHVSVQLFSNEDLAYKMTKNYDLLKIMITSLNSMMSKITINSTIQSAEENDHKVVDCSHRIMKEHCYWPLVSDLNNVFTHKAVAMAFLSDNDLMKMWFNFLLLFQGMNVNHRELKDHVKFESTTYYAAFGAELEASATPMWALISHLKSPETLDKTKEILSICVEAICNWFETIGFNLTDNVNPHRVSFHIPLHRCFAMFLGQGIKYQGANLDDLLPPENVLKMMMMHPLQAQVVFHEIWCNMWVRSGLQIKGQAMTYIQCHFCNSVVDADLFLLQICAMKLDPDWFLKTVMEKFHVWEWLTFHPNRNNSFLEKDKVLPMLEGFLCFLTTLLSIHTNIGQTEEEVTRQEMVSLLCMSDRTHSQLLDLLPDKCGATSQNKDFESILEKVADFKAPNFESGGTMVQGMYVPRAKIWEEEYNPIHVFLRAVQRREYQASLDRFAQYLRQSNKISSSQPPWPPYRIPGSVHKEFVDPRRILHCKTMHGIIFTILHRAVNDPDIPEQVLSLCIYLLDMAVRFPYSGVSDDSKTDFEEVEDMKFLDWFNSCDTLQNVSKLINKILISEKVVMSMRLVEEMEVDEEAEEAMEFGFDVYEIQSPIVEVEEIPDSVLQQFMPSLPASGVQLALPSVPSDTPSESAPDTGGWIEPVQTSSTVIDSASSSQDSQSQTTSQTNESSSSSSSFNMALIPTPKGLTTLRPKCMKLKQVPGRHAMLLSDKGLPLAIESCNLKGSSSDQKYMPFRSKRTINVKESILSLLLQLHSKLSEKPDSYQPKTDRDSVSLESRIGDGAKFLERILDIIAFSGEDKLQAIQNIRQNLWPKKDATGSPSMENIDKEERRRRAKERQQKLMAEFASKQKAFMQKNLETEGLNAAASEEAVSKEKEFECVICGQTTASEEDRPVGMVVLLQATSIIGHSHETPNRKLPCSEEECIQLQKGYNLATVEKNRVDFLAGQFDSTYWPMAINIGWEGGVYVQSCGHYLHIDCHKSYIQSLKTQSSTRLANLAVERGEYSCPLCRQLANSVLPLYPNFGKTTSVIISPVQEIMSIAFELTELLSTPSLSERDSKLLKKYMANIMEDITDATYPQYRTPCSPNSSSLFLFICSIARTNLEVELIQRGGTLRKPFKKKSCFAPLMHVLSMHSRLLLPTLHHKVWARLTGQLSQNELSLAAVWSVDVPLLVRDGIALLLRIVLTLPLNIDKAYYTCVVQVLYNFMYIQGLAQLSSQMKSAQRTLWEQIAQRRLRFARHDNEEEMNQLTILLYYVKNNLENSCLYVEDDEMCDKNNHDEWSDQLLEEFMVDYCIHYLRIASLLQSHLFEEDIPELKDDESEFHHLCKYLNLGPSYSTHTWSSSFLKWVVVNAKPLIDDWCQDFVRFLNKSVVAARALIVRQMKWYPPALLKLPHNYDDIFKFYHKKTCTVCHSEPKDPSLCLVCGTMVCLREGCCRRSENLEAVMHSITCGAGTAMYLAVNSSTIIVVRGKRACLWGSVYLDSYGEEDRDLKRGKPLYLSEDRYNLLQQQWINHSFDHTNKRWVWHKDNL